MPASSNGRSTHIQKALKQIDTKSNRCAIIIWCGWLLFAFWLAHFIATADFIKAKESEEPGEEEGGKSGDVKMGITMLGSVFTVMGIYYFLHSNDVQMRKYSYGFLIDVTSIFLAVLTFSSLNHIAEVVMTGWPRLAKFFFRGIFALFWQLVFLGVITLIAKIFEKDEAEEVEEEFGNGNEEAIEKLEADKQLLEVEMKANGQILAHMVGFANLSFWASIQEYVAESTENVGGPFWSLCMLFVAFFLTACQIFLLNQLYRLFLDEESQPGEDDMIGNNVGNKIKQLPKIREKELWEETVTECEHDYMGLSLAFLFVQALRFWFGGVIPNAEGEEEESISKHSCRSILLLYLVSILCVIALGIYIKFVIHDKEKIVESGMALHQSLIESNTAKQNTKSSKKEELEKKLIDRGLDVLANFVAMSFAWSFMYATIWYLGALGLGGDDETLLTIVAAAFLSLVGFIMIRILDLIADESWTNEQTDEVILKVIASIGVLIGFSWEKGFDSALLAVAEESASPLYVKTCMGLLCTIVILPQWRMYMIPMREDKGYRFGFIPKRFVHRAQVMIDNEQTQADKVKRYFQIVDAMNEILKIPLADMASQLRPNDDDGEEANELWNSKQDSITRFCEKLETIHKDLKSEMVSKTRWL